MIVKFTMKREGKGEGADPSFTLGENYFVHGITFRSEGRSTMIGIQRGSDGTPVLVELKYFDIINPAIPSDWYFFDFKNGCYCLQPKEFGGNFWDEFHDDQPIAEKVFLEILNKIKTFHNESKLDKILQAARAKSPRSLG